ncbi:ATP-binding protein [Algoriphagus halophytocola]|uniref:ATP-binding protein n=1 Tax=Algoriphagus halophytocola TaxID=2991499 RepID=A0ABY6MM75_9BACT|nr:MULTISPECIES: ATP-binding protein [unclassified Algoriphagus]UZD24089.1 ATP-binding protein [Algoriphagus sp. TR-M5]WBL41460.1 ATP-binding protein [Algoriphagus sp. TR-M9]
MKEPFNPFVINTYQGKDYFCDRENDLKTLISHIENDRNVVLYAWRRLGKSALIHRLFEELETSKGCETIYIDLLATQNIAEAIQSIASAIYEKYGRTTAGISASIQKLLASIGATISFNALSGLPEISIGINRSEQPGQSLKALGDFLLSRKKRLVIAIDEFQQIADYEGANAEAIFRTWVQQIPEVRFIFSGSHRTLMEAMFTEKKRPFYQSSQLESLQPIALKAYTKFITEHFQASKKTIEADSIEKIYTWSRGQTYTVQLACNHLFANYKKVSLSDVDVVFDQVLTQQQAVFANFQKMLTRAQWNVFRAIAKEEPLQNPLSKDFIQKHNLGAASTVSTALKALERLELVVKDEGNYLVHEVQLARWMARL